MFEIITGITLPKWWFIFDTEAPIHDERIRSLAPTIMSRNGKNANITSAGRYCSLRAARKMILSRNPTATSRTITGMSAQVEMSP